MASTAGSGSGLHQRHVVPSARAGASPPGSLRPDVEPPPPPPRPLFQVAGFAFIVVLACLQFLPATHFRHPAEPRGTWVPVQQPSNRTESVGDGKVHVYSWSECLDLRMLAVLTNSTLVNSRYEENIYFHFIIPEEYKKLSYYKLKVLFPDSNIDIIGQNEVDKAIGPSFHKLAPFLIPTINPSSRKYMYMSPDIIVQANIQELFEVDLGPHVIGAAEDCTTKLGAFIGIDFLKGIQAGGNSLVPKEPYDSDACMIDFNVLLLDSNKLARSKEALLWWIKVLHLNSERDSDIKLAITLAFYGKYHKIAPAWMVRDPVQSNMDEETKMLHFDGPRASCSKQENADRRTDTGNVWKQYFSPKSDSILSH